MRKTRNQLTFANFFLFPSKLRRLGLSDLPHTATFDHPGHMNRWDMYFFSPMLFVLHFPARLSQDSNMFRTIVTDGEGLHGLSFALAHAWSCDAKSRKAVSMTAAMTVVAPCGRSA